jgi:hypothetical protein
MADNKPDVKDLMRQGAQGVSRRGLQRDAERAARAQAGNTETAIWLPLERLTIDEAIQVRVGGVDAATVEQYAVVMFEHNGWGPFPPVDVHRDGETLYLSAGFQRLAAARMASEMLVAEGMDPITEVPVNVRPGGYEAALEWSEEDNLRHGKPLSSKDKRNMFRRRLERGHRWATMSDRAIARELGVDHRTIGNWRKKLTGENSPVTTERTYITKHGTPATMDTSRIAERNRQRAADEDDTSPPAQPAAPATDIGDWEPEAYPTPSPDEPPSAPGHLEILPDTDDADVPALTGHELRQVTEALQDVIGAAHTLSSLVPEHLDGLPPATLDGLTDLLVRAGHAMTGSADQRGQPVPGLVDRVEALLDHIDVLLYGEE